MKELLTKWAIQHIRKQLNKLKEPHKSYVLKRLQEIIEELKPKEV